MTRRASSSSTAEPTIPDEVAPWDRVAVDARDIGQDYDAEGNRIRKYTWTDADNDDTVDWNATEISEWTEYTWDHRNRLTQVESGAAFETTDVTVTFAYDYLNRWIATDVNTTPATPGDETGEYFVYGQATLPDEVAPWDRAATDARDIGQIALRLNEDGEISNRYLWGAAVDQILADEQISWTGQAYSTNRTLWPPHGPPGHRPGLWPRSTAPATPKSSTPRTYDAYGNLLADTARRRRPPLRLHRPPHRRGDRLAEQPQPLV